jgi:hypothetical protein
VAGSDRRERRERDDRRGLPRAELASLKADLETLIMKVRCLEMRLDNLANTVTELREKVRL